MEFYRNASAKLAAAAAFIGLLVLAGWAADIPTLKSIFPNLVSMKANTALCFVLMGASLWSLHWKIASRILAITTLAISVMTLSECIFNWDLGIDQLLFQDATEAILTISPGRMATNTAVCFTLLGTALLFASTQNLRTKIIAQSLFALTGGIATLAVLGYAYGVTSFHISIVQYTPMALHSGVAFILLALGGLLGLPKMGLMRFVIDDSNTGKIARRAILTVSIIVVGTDFLAELGNRLHFYDDKFANALHATIMMASFYVVIIASAYISGREEQKKRQFEASLDVSEHRYKDLYNTSSDAIMMFEPGSGFTGANPATLKLFGCKDETEFITKTPADISPEHQPDGESSVEKSQRMMAIAMEKGTHFFEWKHRSADGREFWATVLISRVDGGDHPTLQASVRDIDVKKIQAIEMERFYAVTIDREQRIIELKNEINALKEELIK